MNILYTNKNFILMMDDDRKGISVNQILKPINNEDINKEIERYQGKKGISVNQISKPIKDEDINEEIERYQGLIKAESVHIDSIKNSITNAASNELYNASIKKIGAVETKCIELIDEIRKNKIIPNYMSKHLRQHYINKSETEFIDNPKEVLIKKIQNDLAKLSDIKKQLDQTFLNVKNTAIPKIKNDIEYPTTQESSSLIKRAVGAKASFLKDLGNLLDKTTKKLAYDNKIDIKAYLSGNLQKTKIIIDAFKNKQSISGQQLKNAIDELKESDTFSEVDAKGKPTADAKLVQKLVHQLELMPANAVVQAAKIEKSKTNIFNRIFKRGDYKVAKEAKNEIKKELNDVEAAREDFLKEKTDIERKIKNIDEKLLSFDNKNDQHTTAVKLNLETEKKALNKQLDNLKSTFKKTVSYKGDAILDSKANKKIKDQANKIQEKLNKVEKEIKKLAQDRLKLTSTSTQSQRNKIIAINEKLITLNITNIRLNTELQQQYTLMQQTLEAPENVTKTTIIDPSINKSANPLSTNKAIRSFSITSATQINEKNLYYGNKFKSFDQLLKTDINNPVTIFDKALSSSRNDPKLFEKKMNNEIDKEVKARIEFKIQERILKRSPSYGDNQKQDKADLKSLEKEIKEHYTKLGKEAKAEVKAFAKEMKELTKGMNR